jgi:hypothetical protein
MDISEVDALKKLLLLAAVAAVLGGMAASAQSYSPNDMKVLGTLDSGQTSSPVDYSHPGPYRAFVFEGHGRDFVEVTVTGADGRAFVALADATLAPIASGIGRLAVRLPYHGPDLEAFYILVKPTSNRPARLAVHLKNVSAAPQPADATR